MRRRDLTEPYDTPDPLASVERLLDHACASAMIGEWGQEKSREAVRLLFEAVRVPCEIDSPLWNARKPLLAFARQLEQR